MPFRSAIQTRFFLIALAILSVIPTKVIQAGQITIQRDTWGVPHVFASNLADGAYALGYAQAEDRLEQIFANYLTDYDWTINSMNHQNIAKIGLYPKYTQDFSIQRQESMNPKDKEKYIQENK